MIKHFLFIIRFCFFCLLDYLIRDSVYFLHIVLYIGNALEGLHPVYLVVEAVVDGLDVGILKLEDAERY